VTGGDASRVQAAELRDPPDRLNPVGPAGPVDATGGQVASSQLAPAVVASADEASSQPPSALRVVPIHKRSLADHVEHFISRLTSRSVFWHRISSLIWLPYAFRSGIKMRQIDAGSATNASPSERDGKGQSFTAILPFRRFNRNWYNAMAGAALVGNSEIAGGTYIYGKCGGDYTVVCKNINYTYQRPCHGPAVYRMSTVGDLDALLKTGREFNIGVQMQVFQQLPTKGLGREVRVGECFATFHVTPKSIHRMRAARRAARQ